MSLARSSGIAGLVEASPRGAAEPPAPPRADVQLPMGSLPHVFGTTLATIPADVPYLRADARLVESWREKLAAYRGLQVAIAWQGRTSHPNDPFRSLPLAMFGPLAEVPGVRLLSVQKSPGVEQIAGLGGRFDVVDLQAAIDEPDGDFSHTAAILQNVDLVVSCDTSIAHVAGALGRRVWVALHAGPDWRWLSGRSDSPWYPTMRLFRQSTLGDWHGVIAAMADDLRSLAAR
jgi:hypothetical protein